MRIVGAGERNKRSAKQEDEDELRSQAKEEELGLRAFQDENERTKREVGHARKVEERSPKNVEVYIE